jgi:DNA-binding beta-propeller fold protein YncE
MSLRSNRRATVWLAGVAVLVACGQGGGEPSTATAVPSHSSPLAASADGTRIYVVHPDTDSVSAVDPVTRAIVFETLLADQPPSKDASTGRYEPSVMPRSLVLDPTGKTLYVTGERNGTEPLGGGVAEPGMVYALDASTGSVLRKSAPLCAEPAGILIDGSGANLFVACSNDDAIDELRASDLGVVARAALPSGLHKLWALAWGPDGTTLLATHLLGPGVSVFATSPLAYTTTWTIPESSANPADPTVPNGEVRAIYDAVPRPGLADGASELWVTHTMLSSSTPEPALDFNTTAFPAISLLNADGDRLKDGLLTVSTGPGTGAFGDVVSGPRSIAFSPDGRYAFVVDANSEDVLVIDADQRAEAQLVRPLPGHMPEGILWSPDGKVYVMERNTEDLAVLDVSEELTAGGADASVGAGLSAVVEGSTIPTVSHDPMPAQYRLGQNLFHSANSDEYPLTQNHWIACATCHIEDRTDAITWRFLVGPRDTPSNAGGTLHTGFLMHTADRREVADYWLTINEEQGGDFDKLGANAAQTLLLEAIQAFVNYAIPVPVPPTTDKTLVHQGSLVFASSGCPTCHTGAYRTDSACSNPNLDLAGPEVSACTPGGVLVHNVGTCNTGVYPDLDHSDMDGDPRDPCAFDTPSLRGLWDSAPYMHDGSRVTLEDAVDTMILAASKAGGPATLSANDKQALVEYLKSL